MPELKTPEEKKKNNKTISEADEKHRHKHWKRRKGSYNCGGILLG